MTDSITITSNIGDLLEALEFNDQELIEALAAKTIEFELDLRGSSPGDGITPFDTGRLLTSGETFQDGLSLVFENDAAEPGKQGYAIFAHHSGDEVGGYARGAEAAFRRRFDMELRPLWARISAEALS